MKEIESEHSSPPPVECSDLLYHPSPETDDQTCNIKCILNQQMDGGLTMYVEKPYLYNHIGFWCKKPITTAAQKYTKSGLSLELLEHIT